MLFFSFLFSYFVSLLFMLPWPCALISLPLPSLPRSSFFFFFFFFPFSFLVLLKSSLFRWLSEFRLLGAIGKTEKGKPPKRKREEEGRSNTQQKRTNLPSHNQPPISPAFASFVTHGSIQHGLLIEPTAGRRHTGRVSRLHLLHQEGNHPCFWTLPSPWWNTRGHLANGQGVCECVWVCMRVRGEHDLNPHAPSLIHTQTQTQTQTHARTHIHTHT